MWSTTNHVQQPCGYTLPGNMKSKGSSPQKKLSTVERAKTIVNIHLQLQATPENDVERRLSLISQQKSLVDGCAKYKECNEMNARARDVWGEAAAQLKDRLAELFIVTMKHGQGKAGPDNVRVANIAVDSQVAIVDRLYEAVCAAQVMEDEFWPRLAGVTGSLAGFAGDRVYPFCPVSGQTMKAVFFAQDPLRAKAEVAAHMRDRFERKTYLLDVQKKAVDAQRKVVENATNLLRKWEDDLRVQNRDFRLHCELMAALATP